MHKPSYIPKCKTGKNGRYYVRCHDYTTGRQWNIGWRLNKKQAIDCADACEMFALVLLHKEKNGVITTVYRNRRNLAH